MFEFTFLIFSQISLRGSPVCGRGFTCEAFVPGDSQLVQGLILLQCFHWGNHRGRGRMYVPGHLDEGESGVILVRVVLKIWYGLSIM